MTKMHPSVMNNLFQRYRLCCLMRIFPMRRLLIQLSLRLRSWD